MYFAFLQNLLTSRFCNLFRFKQNRYAESQVQSMKKDCKDCKDCKIDCNPKRFILDGIARDFAIPQRIAKIARDCNRFFIANFILQLIGIANSEFAINWDCKFFFAINWDCKFPFCN